jgi:hypothetical protein
MRVTQRTEQKSDPAAVPRVLRTLEAGQGDSC